MFAFRFCFYPLLSAVQIPSTVNHQPSTAFRFCFSQSPKPKAQSPLLMNNIAQSALNAGLVGAGGAGFPTHIKLQASVATVIANGVECEPLLAHDRTLMTENPGLVLKGLDLLAQSVGASRKIIALKKKYSAARAALEKASPKAEIALFPDYYPAGDEVEIIKYLLNRTVPENGLPLDVDTVVDNVETLVNLAQAMDGFPVTQRTLTICGEIERPGVYKTPIGTKIADLLAFAGGTTIPDYRIYIGGPMMGNMASPETPVTKTTTGIFVLPAEHFLIAKRSLKLEHILRQAQSACTDCRQCTDACPRYLLGHDLEPHKIMRTVNLGLAANTREMLASHLCCFCGVCEYACPMWLSPRRVYEKTLSLLKEQNLAYPKNDRELQEHPMRNFRRIPGARITSRMGLTKYNVEMPHYKDVFNPKEVSILLKQHIGLPAEPLVKPGVKVLKGELIGEIPFGKLGAKIHASLDGTVSSIDREKIVIVRN